MHDVPAIEFLYIHFFLNHPHHVCMYVMLCCYVWYGMVWYGMVWYFYTFIYL